MSTVVDMESMSTHGQTQTGTVHVVRAEKLGKRTLLSPVCRKYGIFELVGVYATDAAVTCKACLKRQASV